MLLGVTNSYRRPLWQGLVADSRKRFISTVVKPRKCSQCDVIIRPTQIVRECDICNKWCHQKCQDVVHFTKGLRDVHDLEAVVWFCPDCRHKKDDVVTQFRQLAILNTSWRQSDVKRSEPHTLAANRSLGLFTHGPRVQNRSLVTCSVFNAHTYTHRSRV